MAAARSAKSFSQQVATVSRARRRRRLRLPRREAGRVLGHQLCCGDQQSGVFRVPHPPLQLIPSPYLAQGPQEPQPLGHDQLGRLRQRGGLHLHAFRHTPVVASSSDDASLPRSEWLLSTLLSPGLHGGPLLLLRAGSDPGT